MRARPYKLFGDHERAAAREGVEARAARWAAGWLPEGGGLAIECAPACEAKARFASVPETHWRRASVTDALWLAVRLAESDLQALAGALYGAEPGVGASEAAVAAAHAGMHELLAALMESPREAVELRRGKSAAPGEASWQDGSAALALHANFGAAQIDVVSSPDFALRLLGQGLLRPAQAALVDRRRAVASQRVALQVQAGTAELHLRGFTALGVGDVITLNTRIDEPMAVVVAAGARPKACAGRLGVVQGRRSVALTIGQEG